MGLFRRKSKKKNKVSFGADVSEEFSDLHNDETMDKASKKGNSVSSSSSSSLKGEEQQQEITSYDEILLPFREPKAIASLCSDIESNHNHKSHQNIDVDNNSEHDYMEDSVDIDEMDEMTADPQEENFDYMTLQASRIANERKQSNSNNEAAKIYKPTVMPSIPDLEISNSGRIDDRNATPGGTNKSAQVTGSIGSKSNNKNNSTKKAQDKTAHVTATAFTSNNNNNNNNNLDVNQSYQSSGTSTASGSTGSSKEQQQQVLMLQQQQQQQQHYQQQQQQQHYPQQNQHQHYPQQNQHQHYSQQQEIQQRQTQHEIQSEQTRDLIKVFIGEIWNRGEIESIQKVCSPRLRFNGHTGLERVGHDGFSRMVTTVRSSLEGYHCEIHSMVVEGRKCFCRLKFTGKHVGKLMGYPPTRKLVAWMGASEFTICPRRNQILKVWELGDIKTLEAQLMG